MAVTTIKLYSGVFPKSVHIFGMLLLLQLICMVCGHEGPGVELMVIYEFEFRKHLAFLSPEPPGGLSMRTRRLWGHHFWFKSKLEDSLLKALNHLNLQLLTLLQEQVNAVRNIVESQNWPEVLNIWDFKSFVPRASWSLHSGPQESLGDGNEHVEQGLCDSLIH